MTHLRDLFDTNFLAQMIDEGYVSARPHNEFPLVIYNYSNEAMYDQKWNTVTKQCRGLIAHEDGTIVARPFPKFFNFGETAQPKFVVTGQPAQIYEKMDGSLGILYFWEGQWHVATRGSFHSEQAIWATWFIQNSWFDEIGWPTDGYTYLVEIIYPKNRIVVNYGDREDLSLLAVLDNETGEDVHHLEHTYMWPFSKAWRYMDTEIQDITHMVHQDEHAGQEGVVMVWPRPGEPAYRLKVKRADYIEMHRIVTGMTARKVWEIAKDGLYVETIIAKGVPEEWADWVREKHTEIVQAKDSILERTHARFDQLMADPNLKKENGHSIDRKKFAKVAKRWDEPGMLFSLLDGKDISEKAWQMVYPPHEVPFGGDFQ